MIEKGSYLLTEEEAEALCDQIEAHMDAWLEHWAQLMAKQKDK